MTSIERRRAANLKYNSSPKGKAYYAAYRASSLGKARALRAQLKHHYGILEADYNRLLASQDGVCAICGGQQTQVGKRLGVDHSHKTGKIRGLLCSFCNSMIGYSRENILILFKAADYIERHNR